MKQWHVARTNETGMKHNNEAAYAKQMLPVLEQQLNIFNTYNRQFKMLSGYDKTCPPLLTMIGMTELKMALANAMISKAELEKEEQHKQQKHKRTRKSKPNKSAKQ